MRARYATLVEIETQWSLVDLFDANAVITAFEVAEAKAGER